MAREWGCRGAGSAYICVELRGGAKQELSHQHVDGIQSLRLHEVTQGQSRYIQRGKEPKTGPLLLFRI